MDNISRVDELVKLADEDPIFVKEDKDLILHVFNEEAKYVVYKCIVNPSINFEEELRYLISLYHRSSRIGTFLGKDLERFVNRVRCDYKEKNIGMPFTNGAGCYWGFDYYYDGTRTPLDDNFDSIREHVLLKQ